ncbi:MAG TPA: hypothetical protein VNC62_13625 [Burkholderiales bacterium]|nr:hypothetical protein [Burkholderiales bacterium]
MRTHYYHYLTLEQRDALETRLRAANPDERHLQTALERLRQPDYGVCIECGKDALHCGDCARLPIKR